VSADTADTMDGKVRTADMRDGYIAQVMRRRLYSFVLLLIFVVLMVSGFRLAEDRNAGGFLNGISQILDFPAGLLGTAIAEAPERFVDQVVWLGQMAWQFVPSLIETINIAAASTLLGAMLAIVLSLLATRGLARWPGLIGLFRRIMDIMRAVPEIVIALVLIFVLSGGPVPAMIAIAFHTAGALGKLFSEVNENADLKPVEGLNSVGAGWMQRMWLGVIPQVAPNYLSYALMRFEINIRASAILGFVGSGGIGYDLKNAIAMEWRYDEAAVIFLLLFLTIVFFDQVSSWGRDKLIGRGAR